LLSLLRIDEYVDQWQYQWPLCYLQKTYRLRLPY